MMRTLAIEGTVFQLPDYTVDKNDYLVIQEDDLKDVKVKLSKIQMDDTDETLLHYDVEYFPEDIPIEKVKEFADALIIIGLHDGIAKKHPND